ncbi:MAG TPA: hypothetical protein VEL28_03895 [Candidatus Binatia bacterium]|nr:hypothetical protein [Candidatus Binatia bacterium]
MDFQLHWPTDGDHVYVDFVRDGSVGNGAARSGDTRWRRVTERRAGAAKSVFHFDVQGSVAKSTHSGLPWLLRIRRDVGSGVHFWPFDGWQIATGRSAIVEAYPRLWSGNYEREDRSPDQHDAYSVARWLRDTDRDGTLTSWLAPSLLPEELAAAQVEGWILGVGAVVEQLPVGKQARVVADRQGPLVARLTAPTIASGTPPTKTLHVVRGVEKTRASASTPVQRTDAFVHQFLVILGDTEPPVWRRIQVPEHYTFWDLHVAIQDAMGWLDYHLHEFAIVHPKEERLDRIGIPGDEFVGERPPRASWKVKVTDYMHQSMPPILYTYDFGDDWRHVVLYEETMSAEESVQYPRCVAGARRCPPEDCGGSHGYREFLAAIENPRHPERAANLRWVGGSFDPAAFDPGKVHFDDPRERRKKAFGRR